MMISGDASTTTTAAGATSVQPAAGQVPPGAGPSSVYTAWMVISGDAGEFCFLLAGIGGSSGDAWEFCFLFFIPFLLRYPLGDVEDDGIAVVHGDARERERMKTLLLAGHGDAPERERMNCG